mmetsp:Transcript_12659/g.41466  ORF Transcript_12659/g.41466 Transcript_12659/m.41466 type:complete len:331 (+) Transcript_12659:454-1446(+)
MALRLDLLLAAVLGLAWPRARLGGRGVAQGRGRPLRGGVRPCVRAFLGRRRRLRVGGGAAVAVGRGEAPLLGKERSPGRRGVSRHGRRRRRELRVFTTFAQQPPSGGGIIILADKDADGEAGVAQPRVGVAKAGRPGRGGRRVVSQGKSADVGSAISERGLGRRERPTSRGRRRGPGVAPVGVGALAPGPLREDLRRRLRHPLGVHGADPQEGRRPRRGKLRPPLRSPGGPPRRHRPLQATAAPRVPPGRQRRRRPWKKTRVAFGHRHLRQTSRFPGGRRRRNRRPRRPRRLAPSQQAQEPLRRRKTPGLLRRADPRHRSRYPTRRRPRR